MSSKLNTLILLSSFAFAACASVPSQNRRIASTQSEHISNTGAVFVLDTSVPALGEAYRDPSGLIWGSIAQAGVAGSVITSEGPVYGANVTVAANYCKSIGARLPTKEELDQLVDYLGLGSDEGYSPLCPNSGGVEVLPGLSKNSFWSSTVNPMSKRESIFLNGVNGQIDYAFGYTQGVFRCVVGH